MGAFFTFTVVGLLVYGFDYARQRNTALRIAYLGFAAIVTLRGIRALALHAAANISHPPRYDFLCFWLDGRVALLHRNVYAPAFFHLLGDRLHQPADWVREFLDIGFLYPPMSIVWFAPLGLFSTPGAAIIGWYALLFGTLTLAAIALWRQFFGEWGLAGLLVPAALLMVFPATSMTLDVTQTIGIALLFALLFRGERNAWRAGIWIALALSIKPFLITLLIVPLVTRSWRTIFGCAATVAALCATSFVIVGPAAFATYLHDNPVTRVPGYMYSGIWNQSLLGWILRFSHREPALLAVNRETLYLVLAASIAGVTVAACAWLARTNRDAAIALSLMLGLLIYPQTLYFYALLLMLPIAIAWAQRGQSPQQQFWLALAIAAIATLVGVPDGACTYLAMAGSFTLIGVMAFAPAIAGRQARLAGTPGPNSSCVRENPAPGLRFLALRGGGLPALGRIRRRERTARRRFRIGAFGQGRRGFFVRWHAALYPLSVRRRRGDRAPRRTAKTNY